MERHGVVVGGQLSRRDAELKVCIRRVSRVRDRRDSGFVAPRSDLGGQLRTRGVRNKSQPVRTANIQRGDERREGEVDKMMWIAGRTIVTPSLDFGGMAFSVGSKTSRIIEFS